MINNSPEKNVIKPVAPNMKALADTVKNSSSFTVFSPFYTASGLNMLECALLENNKLKEINFNCRLNKYDWIQGSIDPVALIQMCKGLKERLKINIAHRDSLHAKAYYGDKKGLIGSANLTRRGFGDELEFLLEISGDVLDKVKSWFEEHVASSLSNITIKQLDEFIRQNIDEVNEGKRKIDRTLKRRTPLFYSPLSSFIAYCESLSDSAAETVVRRFYGESNLSGHIINLYHASFQFLDHNRDLLLEIANIPANSFHLIDQPFKDKWIEFINSEELEDMPDEGYLARSTHSYLPTVLGGTQTSGGGGRGNLDRVLPLVAQFIVNTQSS